jgi:hypothetical protein
MKKHLLFFGLFSCGLAFGQNQCNGPLSFGLSGPETFRFGPGIVTQDQSLSGFGFGPTARWFSLGQVSSGTQTFYGNRFQYNERALVTGYTNASPNNPRIEWIHNGGSTSGNLEFRVANSFTGGASNLVASMTPQGNTFFSPTTPIISSNSPKVGIHFTEEIGLEVLSNGNLLNSNTSAIAVGVSHSGFTGKGLQADVVGGLSSYGVFAKAIGDASSIAVYGSAPLNTQFSAAIYGLVPSTGGNIFAGYFDGDVYTTGNYLPSDEKIKNNITPETSALEKILMLYPVSYSYNKVEGMSLPQSLQHGFISQEMAEVFPELTKDIKKPIFDEDGNITGELSFKAINYVGLISLLTAAVQELNKELTQVRQDLDEYKINDEVRGQIVQNSTNVNGYAIEQNVPNPFSDRTSIRFQLTPGVESATLSIFNLNGAFVRDYPLNGNTGEVEILASDIGKGMFIYSLNQNGQEIISKRMIVK